MSFIPCNRDGVVECNPIVCSDEGCRMNVALEREYLKKLATPQQEDPCEEQYAFINEGH